MKKNKLPNLVVILILTLITVIMWISFNIYRSLTTKPAPAVPPEISEPLTPSLDTQTLDGLNSKLYLNQSQIPEAAPTTQATATPTAIPTIIPTATPISSPTTASESATPTP